MYNFTKVSKKKRSLANNFNEQCNDHLSLFMLFNRNWIQKGVKYSLVSEFLQIFQPKYFYAMHLTNIILTLLLCSQASFIF